MYLTHHYFVDLIGGAMLSFIVFEFVKYKYLPICDSTKFCRWSYSELEFINVNQIDPLSSNYVYLNDDESRLYTRIHPQNIQIQQIIATPSILSTTRGVVNESQIPNETFEMANLAHPISIRNNNNEEEEEGESDISSTSNTPSVFEEEHLPSSVAASSTTSLDEMETQSTSNYINPPSFTKANSFAKNR